MGGFHPKAPSGGAEVGGSAGRLGAPPARTRLAAAPRLLRLHRRRHPFGGSAVGGLRGKAAKAAFFGDMPGIYIYTYLEQQNPEKRQGVPKKRGLRIANLVSTSR